MSGARDRINSFLGRASVDDSELTGIDEAELRAELRARVAARKKRPPKKPEENPRSRFAGASSEDATVRAQMAERRRAKVHAVRNERAAARQAEEDEAFRRVKEQARQRPSSPHASRPSSRHGGSSSWRERAASGLGNLGRDETIAGYYKVLDLPYGSSQSEVKSAYRKLMRKYHPDRHNRSPKKQKAATELTMKVTQAYNGLEQHFKSK